jgi:hypothetical protein
VTQEPYFLQFLREFDCLAVIFDQLCRRVPHTSAREIQ